LTYSYKENKWVKWDDKIQYKEDLGFPPITETKQKMSIAEKVVITTM